MWKKHVVIALAAFAFGVTFAPRSNAGTEVVEPYSAPAPRYNYAPTPRPIYYAPPVVRVAFYPPFGFYGPRFGVFGVRRFHGPHGHRHFHHWR